MALTNQDVAHRLFSTSPRDARGSNFRIERCDSEHPVPSALGGFKLHSRVLSYSTVIALLVQHPDSTDNGDPAYELWSSPTRHSNTTMRHRHHLANALYAHNSKSTHNPIKPENRLPGAVAVYTFAGAESYFARTNPQILKQAIEYARQNMYNADTPRIHEDTRRTHIGYARKILNTALFNATNCIPQQTAQHYRDHAEWVDAAQSFDAFLHTLQNTTCVNELRATVRAMRELATN